METTGSVIGASSILHTVENKLYPVRNVEKEIMEMSNSSAVTPKDVAFTKVFRERRLGATETQSASVPSPSSASVTKAGYAMVYENSFRHAFTYGTGIQYTIINPITTGGGVTDYLYLTTTNRAAMGCEALVSYHDNSSPLSFQIFDWSLSTPSFIVTLSYAQLSNYLHTITAGGATRQCLRVLNRTYSLSNSVWANVVYLYAPSGGYFAQIYSRSYAATRNDQTGIGAYHWGPTVETAQSSFPNTTGTFGFADTQLEVRDQNDNWSSTGLLSTNQSFQYDDSLGFVAQFLSPNYTWGVKIP